MKLTEGTRTVELTWIGEGWNGYYQEGSDDEKLLRLYVSDWNEEEGEFQDVEDASHCTHLSLSLDDGIVEKVLKYIMFQLHGATCQTELVRECERMSWLSDKIVEDENWPTARAARLLEQFTKEAK